VSRCPSREIVWDGATGQIPRCGERSGGRFSRSWIASGQSIGSRDGPITVLPARSLRTKAIPIDFLWYTATLQFRMRSSLYESLAARRFDLRTASGGRSPRMSSFILSEHRRSARYPSRSVAGREVRTAPPASWKNLLTAFRSIRVHGPA